jgi:radical SAM superfamily enzyme with C-terminal helix-hairpin-helix motif
MKIAIVDGYVDEPSCLGVPPYISPYPRYIYGMLKKLKFETIYTTIDALRENYRFKKSLYDFDLVIVIAGMVVPGKYIGGKPLGLKELISLFPADRPERKILVGPIILEISKKERRMLENYEIFDFPFESELFDFLCKYSNKVANGVVKNNTTDRNFVNEFSLLGAEVVKQHPDFPYIVCEVETYKGCYWRKCSFCIERIHDFPSERDPKAVLAEIEALYGNGCRYFRIGNQTDFFSYMGDFNKEVPKPNPSLMRNFHRAIWERCPKIKTLHMDNANPKTIATWPEESKEIIKTIVIYQTPGNIAAMGLESADDRVIETNNLAANPDEVMEAIKLVNTYGRQIGYNGLPCFLPGLNFVIGLKRETKETFDVNYSFLEGILEGNLWIRRINIRQVKIFTGTPMEKVGDKFLKKHKREFRIFKEKVRKNIDRVLLRKMLPLGRKITDVRCEYSEGSYTYGRQLATYPLLVAIKGNYPKNRFLDVRIADYGMRSVTGVEDSSR